MWWVEDSDYISAPVQSPDTPAELNEGDIISYLSLNPESYGEVVTHKIRTLTQDDKGAPGFITYGTTTGEDGGAVETGADTE